MKPKLYLYVRPRKSPKWWPRDSFGPVWCGVLKDGVGWVVGSGDAMNAQERATARKLVDVLRPEFQVSGFQKVVRPKKRG